MSDTIVKYVRERLLSVSHLDEAYFDGGRHCQILFEDGEAVSTKAGRLYGDRNFHMFEHPRWPDPANALRVRLREAINEMPDDKTVTMSGYRGAFVSSRNAAVEIIQELIRGHES